jgi:hypothetical protein
MFGLATGTYTQLRGTGASVFGDVTDADVSIGTGLVMSILEQSRATTRQADDRAQTVVRALGRCAPTLNVVTGDRFRDEATGATYIVTAVSRVANPVMPNDTRLELERVQNSTDPAQTYAAVGTLTIPFVIG